MEVWVITPRLEGVSGASFTGDCITEIDLGTQHSETLSRWIKGEDRIHPDRSLCYCRLQDHVWDASHYLVRLVFSGLKEMFTGTREIQVGAAHRCNLTVKAAPEHSLKNSSITRWFCRQEAVTVL